MRETLVIVSFLPFLYYATLDGAFHFRGRRVSLAEHVIHLVLGLAVGVTLRFFSLGERACGQEIVILAQLASEE